MNKRNSLHRSILVTQLRAVADESRTIEGYAILFNKESTSLPWREIIATGALDNCDMSDVVCLFNHDNNKLLGRTSNNTVVLNVDDKGLKFTCDIAQTVTGDEVLTLIRRGDIKSCSFCFEIENEHFESSPDPKMKGIWVIDSISKLYDVSPVTFAAYEDTEVAARGALRHAEFEKDQNEKTDKATQRELTRTFLSTCLE